MVIDASALIAILKAETERVSFLHAIAQAPVKRLSPVNWLEAALVIEREGPEARSTLEEFVRDAQIQIVPVESNHMMLAREAWMNFGKGRHRAALNLGDCFAYALAKYVREPLLFKGEDFRKTDITAAL
jgi:ribonuclease VapC